MDLALVLEISGGDLLTSIYKMLCHFRLSIKGIKLSASLHYNFMVTIAAAILSNLKRQLR